MEGQKPIFVDAFLNKEGTGVYVVLNFSPLFGPQSKANGFRQWMAGRHASAPKWSCSWSPPLEQRVAFGLETSEVHPAVEEASILFNSLDEIATSPAVSLTRFETGIEGDDDTAAQGLATQFRYRHHAMVLGCRLPDLMQGLPSWRLGISATSGDTQLYERSRIPVQRDSFVKEGTETALCTMVNKVSELLRPWAKFHAGIGFDQILIYVESEDTAAAERALADLIEQGKVTIVPFFFGSVSKQGAFHLQAGMEQHCLYQARGRAAWLGHADEDEFFELRQSASGGIKQFLASVPGDVAAVSVRSQQWRVAANNTAGSLAFPCYVTCKRPGYYPTDKRTKWIARPGQVSVSNPHVVESARHVHVADPDNELRLNHFRHVKSGMTSTDNNGCSEDLSFRDSCDALVKAPLAQRTLKNGR